MSIIFTTFAPWIKNQHISLSANSKHTNNGLPVLRSSIEHGHSIITSDFIHLFLNTNPNENTDINSEYSVTR